jgi:hypothetical protein
MIDVEQRVSNAKELQRSPAYAMLQERFKECLSEIREEILSESTDAVTADKLRTAYHRLQRVSPEALVALELVDCENIVRKTRRATQ